MNHSIRNKCRAAALCGMLIALAVVIQLLGGYLAVAMYIAPAIAGMLVYVAKAETSGKNAFLVYLAVSLLSAILVPDWEVILLFVLLLGYYPSVKEPLENRISGAPALLLKLVLYLAAVSAVFLLVRTLLTPGVPYTAEELIPEAALAGVGLVLFLVYDKLLAKLFRLYSAVWRRHLKTRV